jgi:hypothetical protein
MLRLTRTPPAHGIDDKPMWIAGDDPAWDVERIEAERAKLGKNVDAHPVNVYYSGKTRFSLDAKISLPRALCIDDAPMVCTIESYFKPGAAPTLFELRALGSRDEAIARVALNAAGFYEYARRGLGAVTGVEDDKGRPQTLDLPRDRDGSVSEKWFDDLADRSLIAAIGWAVYTLTQNEVVVDEGKP